MTERIEDLELSMYETASPDEVFTKFIDKCNAKQLAGEMIYGAEVFVGSVTQEYEEEQFDSKNYLDEMFKQELISQEEYDYAFGRHLELFMWMQSVKKR